MGNDDDYVDDIAVKLLATFADALEGKKNCRGGYYRAGTGSAMYYLWHAEQIGGGGGEDHGVVLCHNVVDHREVGAIVKGQPLLTVVDVKVIGHHVLAADKVVAKALDGHISQYIVVVLIPGGDQPCRMAGIGHQLLTEIGVSHLLPEAELGIGHAYAADVLQIDRRLCGVHFFMIDGRAEFQIGNRKL